MSKTQVGFLLGFLFATVGTIVQLWAGSLATHWERLGPDAWGGTTDPATERTYYWLGLSLLAFGLTVAAMTFYRWLVATDRTVRTVPVEGNPPASPRQARP
jgi:hypothetical protein